MKTIHTIKINTKLEEGAIVYSLRGHDRMVAGFINTHAISVYHHKRVINHYQARYTQYNIM